jgi:hypothetical protein
MTLEVFSFEDHWPAMTKGGPMRKTVTPKLFLWTLVAAAVVLSIPAPASARPAQNDSPLVRSIHMLVDLIAGGNQAKGVARHEFQALHQLLLAMRQGGFNDVGRGKGQGKGAGGKQAKAKHRNNNAGVNQNKAQAAAKGGKAGNKQLAGQANPLGGKQGKAGMGNGNRGRGMQLAMNQNGPRGMVCRQGQNGNGGRGQAMKGGGKGRKK